MGKSKKQLTLKFIIMKMTITFIALCFTVCIAQAQVKTGDFLLAEFKGDTRLYVAEVFKVSGNVVSCRFLHSQSEYVFKNLQPLDGLVSKTTVSAVVASTKNGKYKAGAKVNLDVYRPNYTTTLKSNDLKKMQPSETLVAKFEDGKNYFATHEGADELEIMKIEFMHTQHIYEFDTEGVIIKSGGKYKAGGKAEFYAVILMPSIKIITAD